eukprot:scaffold7392_cov286-Pinguiococcus_pyrenoidosus.AAC.22
MLLQLYHGDAVDLSELPDAALQQAIEELLESIGLARGGDGFTMPAEHARACVCHSVLEKLLMKKLGLDRADMDAADSGDADSAEDEGDEDEEAEEAGAKDEEEASQRRSGPIGPMLPSAEETAALAHPEGPKDDGEDSGDDVGPLREGQERRPSEAAIAMASRREPAKKVPPVSEGFSSRAFPPFPLYKALW